MPKPKEHKHLFARTIEELFDEFAQWNGSRSRLLSLEPEAIATIVSEAGIPL